MASKRLSRYWLVFGAAVFGAVVAFLQPAPRALDAAPAPTTLSGDEIAAGSDVLPPVWTRQEPPAAPPVAQRGVEGGSVLPAAAAFVETEEGRFEVQTARYHAELTAARGLVYSPRPTKAGTTPAQARSAPSSQQPAVRVRLASVARGGTAIFDANTEVDADSDVAVPDETDGLSFWRAPGFEERYLPRADGVEQSFVLESRPDGVGTLDFVCELETNGLVALPPRPGRAGGIAFVDKDGAFAARYGQVVVRDSRRRGVVLEPALAANGRSVTFSVPGEWLDAAQYPVVVDPLVGGDFQVSSDNATGVASPTVAAGANNFLVVWNDYRNGTSYAPQLYAQIISQGGTMSGEFPISSGVGVPLSSPDQRIEVAFDGSNWLAVWSDDRTTGAGIRGCIISTAGAILGGNDFLIASTTGRVTEAPLVTHNGSDFLVAWLDVPTGVAGGSQVYYARVTSSAMPDTAYLLPSESTAANQVLLFLAPQKPSGDTLLIYRDNGDSPAQTRSVRIAVDASLRDPGGTVLFKETLPDGGFGRPIGAAFVDSAWHILSSFDQIEDSSIYLHKLDTTGAVTPPTGKFAEMGLGPTGFALDDYAPVFAGAGEWLFVRNEKVSNVVYHLLGKRVTFAGVDKDPIPFQIDTSTQGVLRSAVAASTGDAFLVAWLDGRNGSTQPADAKNVFAALVDSTIAGTSDTPLVAAATGSPTSGEAPLTVAFDSAASTGTFDTLAWDFGDGTTSTAEAPSHIYKNNGTYVTQLRLTKGAYTVFDTVVVIVGGGGSIGPGGGTAVGVPLTTSPDMVTGLFISGLAVKLNFASTNQDVVRVTGIVDAGLVPNAVTGLAASVCVGTQSFSFPLDAKGAYKSDSDKTPLFTFALNPTTGDFTFVAVKSDLRATMDALGAHNATVKPAVIVNVPVTVTVGTAAATATVGVSYKATEDVSGVGSYVYLKAGDEVSGSFLITKFAAQEAKQAKTGQQVHSFSVKGQIKRPNGAGYKPGTTGEFRFTIGDFSIGIPVGQFRTTAGKKEDSSLLGSLLPGSLLPGGLLSETQQSSAKLKFVGRVGISGLKKFSVDSKSGQFNLQMVKVPAANAGGSGMPLAKSGANIIKVDLALSFQFDMADGTRFSAGRYIYCSRKDANAKSWKLR